MEDNFNNINISDSEEQPAEYQVKRTNTVYASGTPVVVEEKTDDKRRYIVLLCLICAVIGSVIGGIATGTVMLRNIRSDSADTPSPDADYVVNETVATTQYQETTVRTEETTLQKIPSNETLTPTTVPVTEKEEEKIQSGTFTSSEDKPSDSIVYSAKEIYQNNVDSVVSIEVRSNYSVGYGTGFIISEEGYIVTNFHVVDGARECYVTLYDDSVYTAQIIGYEELNDIAVIKIEPQGEIQSLVYGNSSDLSVGDSVYVIGNPLGDLTFTLTNGVVSALNRLIETGEGISINMFQTNAAINSGNSGGPVFNDHGYVIGIASAKYASSSIEGLSFCIPIDDVRSMIDEIINKGYVSGKPLLGISACDREVENYGFIQRSRSIGGIKIVIIEDGSAAANAGLAVNDIIVAADGRKVTTVSELKTILTEFRSGETIALDVLRDGVRYNVNLVLDEYEPAAARTDSSYIYDL